VVLPKVHNRPESLYVPTRLTLYKLTGWLASLDLRKPQLDVLGRWTFWLNTSALFLEQQFSRHTAVPTPQHSDTHCNTLQHTATYWGPMAKEPTNQLPQTQGPPNNTLQHTATHCNTLQHTATYWGSFPAAPTFLRHRARPRSLRLRKKERKASWYRGFDPGTRYVLDVYNLLRTIANFSFASLMTVPGSTPAGI